MMNALNAATKAERLTALRAVTPPPRGVCTDINNHIHTTYSFSPYSPTLAVYKAYEAQLATAGIVDHDSISGAREFLEAATIIGLPVTCGFELRVDHSHTALGARRTNNPDQGGISYLTFHGVPHSQFDAVHEMLQPIRAARGRRNRAMCDRLNLVFANVALDYDADVVPLSQYADGGSVTERHILFALAGKLIDSCGDALTATLRRHIAVDDGMAGRINDKTNPYRAYDLLGLLKSQLVAHFYIAADSVECPPIDEMVDFATKHQILATYPYLGDVTASVTGDKKAQVFEDAYLDELFELLKALGLPAVSYMPARNTPAQLDRVMALCARHDLLQISGEDINSPRQAFICPQMKDAGFAHLSEAAWALIGHEAACEQGLAHGFLASSLPLNERITHYATIGKEAFQ